MRYLHDETDGICNYAKLRNFVVSKCDFEGKLPPKTVGAGEIREMLKSSENLFGLALPYYYIVASSPEDIALTLYDAVREIESGKGKNRFAIIAYQDGGIISVSGAQLPFQDNAREAGWWEPYSSASRKKV